jgi:hypothetical protein
MPSLRWLLQTSLWSVSSLTSNGCWQARDNLGRQLPATWAMCHYTPAHNMHWSESVEDNIY